MNQLAHIQQCVPYVAIQVANNVADEKIFYLIGGPNGSGKSTLVNQIVKADNIEVLDLDNIATTKNVSSITAARQLLNEDLPRILSSGRSFVLESTLSGTYDMRVIKMARELRYRVVFVFAFLASVEQNIERVAQRVSMGGHDVDINIIRRRYEKSLHNFHKIVPLVDKWLLFYNGESGKSHKVASGTNLGTLVENDEFYSLFNANRLEAESNQLAHMAKIGASEARIAAERAGIDIASVALSKIVNSKQK